jgi:pimeloyl-ACP methyl ester carboxylesterase
MAAAAAKECIMTTVIIAVLLLIALIVALVGYSANTARKVEAALPPRGAFLNIDGERIHYVDTGGAGPAIVMIHGLASNLLHFSYALAGKLAGEFRLILVDRPGSGYSTRAAQADASPTAQAAAIAKLMDALGLTRPLVVGHSLGGAISLALALDHPDCVGALALIAPLTCDPGEPPAIFRGLVIPSSFVRNLIAWTVAVPLAILQGPAGLKMAFAPEEVAPGFATRAGGLLGLRPQAFYGASSDLVAISNVMPSYMRRYGSLKVPFGMLYGRGDRVLDYRANGEAVKAVLPALDLELIEGGHMLLMTAPDRCAALIRRIASRQKAAAAVAEAPAARP